MKDFINSLKTNRLLLVTIIVCGIIVLLDISLLIFDVIQLIFLSGNSASLNPSFLPFNISIIVINAIMIIAIILLVILRKFKVNKSK